MNKALLFALFIIVSTCGKAQEISIDKEFENITEVKVNVVFSDIEIDAVDENTVKVNGYINYSNTKHKYEIKAYKKGTTLIVEVEHPRKLRGNASGQFHITMPALTDVDVNTVSGDISLNGVGQKFVRLNTVSGKIKAENIGSDIKANSISGDIEVMEAKGNLNLNSISGDQTISDVDGNFNGTSISGDFNISNLKGNRKISTISGSVR